MFFKHLYEKGLAQSSYIIGCQATGEAIVIDPQREISQYTNIAENEGLNITHITETHIHADFLSGSRELASVTNGKIYLSDEGGKDWQYRYKHIPLHDGDVINVGNLNLKVMHTPGHTPEHLSFLLSDTTLSKKPMMIFTGDFVFVGDVGRPDLLEKTVGITGTMELSAKQMFNSLRKFKNLPDYVQVWPGHGAGSACGKSLSSVPSSTVGFEKISNWALQIEDESKFINELLKDQPEPPKYFAMMKKINRFGPTVLGGIPHPAKLTLNQFKEVVSGNITILDSRDKLSFAGGHIKGSLNVPDNSAFTTWTGWMLKYDEPYVLITEKNTIEELTKNLVRIGMEHFFGYIADLNNWADHCNELEVVKQITVSELSKLNKDEEIQIIDVRESTEYKSAHIPQAVNIHAGLIENNLEKIDKSKKVVVYCESGDRSSIAISKLMKNGFLNAYNLTGGIKAWITEGSPVEKL